MDKANKNAVVYTCISGNYDELQHHSYIDPDWDYICFTNNNKLLKKKQIGEWKIEPLLYTESTQTKNARYHKINALKIFPQYKKSLWVDANIKILSPYIFDIIKSTDKDLLIPYHPVRNCIYEEADAVLYHKKEDAEIVDNQVKLLKSLNMPENYGLNETRLIFRNHENKQIEGIMDQWWEFLKNNSKRDQLSLSYILFKNNIKVEDISINEIETDTLNFRICAHKNGRFIYKEKDGIRKIWHIGPIRITFKKKTYGKCRTFFYHLFTEPFVRLKNSRKSVRQLEIGPGEIRLKNFEGVNIVKSPATDYIADVANGLPFKNETFDVIYSSHFLEHIEWYKTDFVISEMYRCLKKNGKVEIWIPDGFKIMNEFIKAEEGNTTYPDNWFMKNEQKSIFKWVNGRLFYGCNPKYPSWHKAVFSYKYLEELLNNSGFKNIRKLELKECRKDNHGWINLGVTAEK